MWAWIVGADEGTDRLRRIQTRPAGPPEFLRGRVDLVRVEDELGPMITQRVWRNGGLVIAPLHDIRVLELANWAAAPSAGAMMADLGAEVVKVEALGGDSMRGVLRQAVVPDGEHNPDHPFQFANRGKKSISVDLDRDEGTALVKRIAATVDIVITNLVPSRRERFGLTADDLLEVKPTLVVGTFSGYGEVGEDTSRLGFDTTAFFARGGPQGTILGPDGAPPRFRPGQGDFTAGLALFGAVLAALRARDATGEGQVVEASLLRTAVWSMAADIATSAGDGRPANARKRTETVTPLIEPFRCADDRWVQFAMPIGNAWQRFCVAIGREDFIDHHEYGTPMGRFQHNTELMAELDEIFATRTRDEWTPILDENHLTWAPINNTAEVLADPAVRATGAFEKINHRLAGSFDTVASPFRLHTAESKVRGPAPEPGEHTNEILAAVGLDDATIESLFAAGVVS